jgi:4-amino-4-deoxy-L-arabinose transferase-like glycosyltransferase
VKVVAAPSASRLHPRHVLGLAIGAGIALRLIVIAAGGPPERFEYDDLARNLIAGHGYVYEQLGTPYRSFYAGLGYIAINTAVDWSFPSRDKALLIAQSLYAGVLALVIFHVALRFFGDWRAVAASALVLCHPGLLYYDTRKLHPLGFDALMIAAALWLLLRLAEPRTLGVVAVSGAVLGLAIFQRGSMAAFLVGATCWIVVTTKPRARAWIVAGTYLAACLIVVGSWAARNYAIHGMVLLESMTPQQFWKGNATYSNGSGYLAGGQSVYAAAPESLVRAWRRGTETDHIRLFRDAGLAEVKKDPVRAAALDVKKFVYFWTFPPNSGQQYPARYFAAYLAYYAVVLLAAASGLVVAWRQPVLRSAAALVVILFLSVSIVHALMFIEMRHRWAIEPLMLAFAPAGARAIWTRWRR